MGVDEAGDEAGAAKIHDARPAIAPAPRLALAAHGEDPPVGHREGLGGRARSFESQDLAVEEDPVRRGRDAAHRAGASA